MMGFFTSALYATSSPSINKDDRMFYGQLSSG